MRMLTAVAMLLCVPALASAQGKSCDDVKADIAKKIEANGVKTYSLDVMDKDAQTDGKVVGTCGGGTKKIVYTRGASGSDQAAPAPDSGAKPTANK